MREFGIHSTLRHTPRGLPSRAFLSRVATDILDKNYSLSLVYIAKTRSRALNGAYRRKNYPTNVLSFPLSPAEGELFLTVPVIQSEARTLGVSFTNHLLFLFIHGCLHLKGYDHGTTMTRLEKRFCEQFKISHPYTQ